jgi:hypothetical protein
LTGPHFHVLGHGTPRGIWESPTTVADAQPVMLDVLDLIRTQALPYLDRLGDLEALTAEVERLARDHPMNSNHHEQLFICRLLQDDIHGALHTAEQAVTTARADGRQAALDVAQRVTQTASIAADNAAAAVEILRARAVETRRRLGLPPLTPTPDGPGT